MDSKQSVLLLVATAVVLILLPAPAAQAQNGDGEWGGAPEFGGGQGGPQWGQGQPQWGQGQPQWEQGQPQWGQEQPQWVQGGQQWGQDQPQWVQGGQQGGQDQPQWRPMEGQGQGRPLEFRAIAQPEKNKTVMELANFAINTHNVSSNASLALSTVLEAATARQQDGSIFRVAFVATDGKLQPPLNRVFRADVFQSLAGWSRLILLRPVLFFSNN